MKEVAVQFNDLDDARQIFTACLNYFYAKDLAEAQSKLASSVTKSALTRELEILSKRFEGYLADYLLAQRDAEIAQQAEQESEEEPEPETEAEPEEELEANPLGTKKMPKQKGRRVTKEELEARVAAMEAAEAEGVQEQ